MAGLISVVCAGCSNSPSGLAGLQSTVDPSLVGSWSLDVDISDIMQSAKKPPPLHFEYTFTTDGKWKSIMGSGSDSVQQYGTYSRYRDVLRMIEDSPPAGLEKFGAHTLPKEGRINTFRIIWTSPDTYYLDPLSERFPMLTGSGGEKYAEFRRET